MLARYRGVSHTKQDTPNQAKCKKPFFFGGGTWYLRLCSMPASLGNSLYSSLIWFRSLGIEYSCSLWKYSCLIVFLYRIFGYEFPFWITEFVYYLLQNNRFSITKYCWSCFVTFIVRILSYEEEKLNRKKFNARDNKTWRKIASVSVPGIFFLRLESNLYFRGFPHLWSYMKCILSPLCIRNPHIFTVNSFKPSVFFHLIFP